MKLLQYRDSGQIPLELAAQIRTALLAEWPGPDAGESLIPPQLHPTYFVLADGDRLLSYGRTIWSIVAHLDRQFKLYGLGDVLTPPAHRRRGYAARIVHAATAHIRADFAADAAVLLTQPALQALYRRSGWEHVPGLRVETAEDGDGAAHDAFPMILFLSHAARAVRDVFTAAPVVLPGDEW